MDFPLGIRLEHHVSQVDGSVGSDGTYRKYVIPDAPPSLDVDLGQFWLESAEELSPQECDRLGCPPCCFLVTMKGFSEPGGFEVRFRFIASLKVYMLLRQFGPGSFSFPVIS